MVKPHKSKVLSKGQFLTNLKDLVIHAGVKDYPKVLKTRRAKVMYWFFRNWYIFGQGKGNVIGRFTTMGTELTAFLFIVKFYTTIELQLHHIIFIIAFGMLFSWFLGLVWVSMDLDKMESYASLDRSHFQNEVYNKVVKGKKGSEEGYR